MTRSSVRAALVPTSLTALALVLAACAGQTPPIAEAPPVSAPPPANMNAGDFVGSWGLASYHNEPDRARTEIAARGQCGQPYNIGRGPTGGLMMHLADATQQHELRLKAGQGSKVYIGPAGPAADRTDRELVSYDGRVLILRWVDPEVSSRYGTMVFVRCTGEPATKAPPKKKRVPPKKTPASPPPTKTL